MSKCDERFARQYRYELPPEFPLDLLSSDIVHHLSGPNRCAATQTSLPKPWSAVPANNIQNHSFHSAQTVVPIILAHVCGLLGPCFKTGQLEPTESSVTVHRPKSGRSQGPIAHAQKKN